MSSGCYLVYPRASTPYIEEYEGPPDGNTAVKEILAEEELREDAFGGRSCTIVTPTNV